MEIIYSARVEVAMRRWSLFQAAGIKDWADRAEDIKLIRLELGHLPEVKSDCLHVLGGATGSFAVGARGGLAPLPGSLALQQAWSPQPGLQSTSGK